jgi:hypothetical protein
MKKVFFTIVDDRFYYPAGTPGFVNSFKRFHSDIDLFVFRQDTIDRVFKEKNINFYSAKPTFAKLLTPYYDLVVNCDADHIFLDRCEEILKGDYDVACPINKNDYENTSVENVSEDDFLQGGLVASTNKEFWDVWEEKNKDAMKYKCRENDVMNLVIYNDMSDLKLKILDKDKDYYGCKSLGKEGEFVMKDNSVTLGGDKMYIYHVARGGMIKPTPKEIGFKQEVVDYMNFVTLFGKTVVYGSI